MRTGSLSQPTAWNRPGSLAPMSDSFVNPIFGEHGGPATEVESGGSGDAEVDAVLGSLRGLDDRPVVEHVAVFEQAHETLRRALAGAGQGNVQSPVAGRG